MKNNHVAVGQTFVEIDVKYWESHGRTRSEVRLLCIESPYSDYDGLRDFKPTKKEVKTALDWIIFNEQQHKLSGYTEEQVEVLVDKIGKLMFNE